MSSHIQWPIDEQHVSGVAVTRHPVFVVPSSLIDAADEHREGHPPSEFVFNHATPVVAEFVLDCLAYFTTGIAWV